MSEDEIDEQSVYPNAITDFIKAFNQSDLLAISAALQLDIQNHGKNIRLEEFTDAIIRSGVQNNVGPSYEEVCEFFEGNLRYDYMEDPTVSYFVENIVFYGGNYRVLPGINTDTTELLNSLLEAIFTTKNQLSDCYKENIRQATHLLLVMSESMIDATELPRYSVEDTADDTIHLPAFNDTNKLIGAVRFDKKWLSSFYDEFKIGEDVIDQFLIAKEYLGEDHDPFESVLFSKPLFDNEVEVICLIPATLTKALTDYIKRWAKKMGETDSLDDAFFQHQWQKFYQYADEMGWLLTDIQLPQSDESRKFMEGVFQIDRDKFAYVQMIKGALDPLPENYGNLTKKVAKKNTKDSFTARHQEVTAFLNKIDDEEPMKVLTLFLSVGTGGTMFFMWPKPKGENQTLYFSFSDFEKIVFEGKLEPLTLWKYSKAVSRAGKTTTLGPGSSSLDNFVYYKENGGSLVPRDKTPDYMSIMGVGTDFQRQMVAYRDEHASRLYKGDMPSDVLVRRARDYAPIYKMQHYSTQNHLLIESYGFPVWVVNDASKNRHEKKQILLYVEAVAFWLLKMTLLLKPHLEMLPNLPVEIKIDVDSKLLYESDPNTWVETITVKPLLELCVEGQIITVEIPFDLGTSFAEENSNEGEKSIMRTVLKGFNVILKKHKKVLLPEDLIEHILGEVMQPSHAKMVLMINSEYNAYLDGRGLAFERHISDADKALIDDYLVPNLNLKTPIPAEIGTAKEKNSLCLKVVNSLIAKTLKIMADLDAPFLLKQLMLINEHLLYESAGNDLRMPHQIACYNDFPTAVRELEKKNREIIPTALAVRGLIEFVAAAPPTGNKELDLDTLDELIALMSETIHWASVADTIDLGLNDPFMGLLPSGRLGASYEFFNDYLRPFSLSRAESEVYAAMKQYQAEPAQDETPGTDSERSLYNDPITDKAFKDEWGITLTNVFLILIQLRRVGMAAGESFMTMSETNMISAIQKDLINKIPDDEMSVGLKLLSLEKRAALDTAPKGFDSKDILPWRYNRALSYNRRPLIKTNYPDSGETLYHWGFRHANRAEDNLKTLITGGRLVVQKGGPIEKDVLTYYRHKKGKKYRSQVYGWLKTHTELDVVPYEVTIHEKGVLIADRNYGDVDVMAIDHENKIIYSIECKNTLTARAIHEMKTELDNYIGQDGNSGHIRMHLEREIWLNEHNEQLVKFVKDPSAYLIKSVVLTSNVIPVLYLAKNKSALPIFSFSELVRTGFDLIAKAV